MRSAPPPSVILSLYILVGRFFPLFSLNTLGGLLVRPYTDGHASTTFLKFSCATTSTLGNSTLPLTWSKWLWVLMMVVTGFGVSSWIFARITWPQPAVFVS